MGKNSLGKGGLNAKAGFCYPYNNRYISFLPSDNTEIFISRNVKAKRREFIECDIRKSPFSKPCVRILYINKQQAKDKLLELMGNVISYGEYFEGIRNAYQNAADILDTLPIVELDVEEELGVLKDIPDDEAYYRNGYCTKCKAQMPTEVLHGKISQRSIRFCFNCGAKINGVLWTLIEEGIIKEK